MVIGQFEKSGCTEAETYLSEQVRKGKVKLSWTENSPEYPYGRGPSRLFLAGDDTFGAGSDIPMYLPGFRAHAPWMNSIGLPASFAAESDGRSSSIARATTSIPPRYLRLSDITPLPTSFRPYMSMIRCPMGNRRRC